MTNLLVKKDISNTNVEVKNCAKVLVETLVELDVENVFGYPGAAVLSVYNELAQVENIITRAYNDKEPSIIADYAYTLSQTFSSFYNACPIMAASDKSLAQSRLKLAFLVCKTLKLMLNLLGIEAPEKMLKAA